MAGFVAQEQLKCSSVVKRTTSSPASTPGSGGPSSKINRPAPSPFLSKVGPAFNTDITLDTTAEKASDSTSIYASVLKNNSASQYSKILSSQPSASSAILDVDSSHRANLTASGLSFDSTNHSGSALSSEQPCTSDPIDEELRRLKAEMLYWKKIAQADDQKSVAGVIMAELREIRSQISTVDSRLSGQISTVNTRLANVESKCPSVDKYCKVAHWLDECDLASSNNSFSTSHFS